MILAYVVTFLMLISLITGSFLHKFRNLSLSENYFEEWYDPYLHQKAATKTSGFNLHELVKGDVKIQQLFKDTIERTYVGATFYYQELGEDLIDLLKNSVDTNYQQAQKSHKIHVKKIADLAKINPQKDDLKKAYLHLMHSSKIDADDHEGFICLLDLFHPHVEFNNSSLNLYVIPQEIITVLFKEETAQDFLERRQQLIEQNPNDLEIQSFYNEFIATHHLASHPWIEKLCCKKLE